jgi:hypothetical protein
MKRMIVGLEVGIVGIGFVLASSGCGGAEASSGDGGTPGSDSSLSDAVSADGNPSGEGDDGSAAGDDGNGGDDVENGPMQSGCYTLSGSGSSKQCMFASTPDADAGCASGSTAGSCPSSGIFGCCVFTVDGGPAITATCYYTENQSAANTCENNQYMGFQEEWQTFVP